eukprot:c27909_g1_i1 orf=76-276(+)
MAEVRANCKCFGCPGVASCMSWMCAMGTPKTNMSWMDVCHVSSLCHGIAMHPICHGCTYNYWFVEE